jgi:hypothetical protein
MSDVVDDILKESGVKRPEYSEHSLRLMALLISEIRLLREATAGLRWVVENEIDYANERRRDGR